MSETIGTVDLKIIRLEHYLELIKQRRQLSLAFPDYQLRLIREADELEYQLYQLKKYRDEILTTTERSSYGTINGQKPFYPVS